MQNKSLMESQIKRIALSRSSLYQKNGLELANVLRVIVNSLKYGRRAAAHGKSIERFSKRLDAALLRADIVLDKINPVKPTQPWAALISISAKKFVRT